MRLQPSTYNPDPLYLRHLIEQTGLTQAECARRVGIDPSTLRRNLANGTRTALRADYRTQYALERLVADTHKKEGSMEDIVSLTPENQAALLQCAYRMGTSPAIALDMAVNRFHIAVMQLKEGDLANVDFSQSLKDGDAALGPDAESSSLPGCEEA
jgi:transcriptional regulator with XRE-family HTH domain